MRVDQVALVLLIATGAGAAQYSAHASDQLVGIKGLIEIIVSPLFQRHGSFAGSLPSQARVILQYLQPLASTPQKGIGKSLTEFGKAAKEGVPLRTKAGTEPTKRSSFQGLGPNGFDDGSRTMASVAL